MSDRVNWLLGRPVMVLVGALLLDGVGHAATSEAKRHFDAQGIEFIGGRQTTMRTSIEGLPEAPARPLRTGSSGAMSLRPTEAAAAAAASPRVRPRVSIKEQQLRDQDRLVILQQELSAETGHYQRTRQALDHPAVKGSSDREAWSRLSEQLARHEQNIKALHAEIRRTSSTKSR